MEVLDAVDVIIFIGWILSIVPFASLILWFFFLSISGRQRSVFIVCVEVDYFWDISKFQNFFDRYHPFGGIILRNSCEMFFDKGEDAVKFAKGISFGTQASGISVGVGICFGNVRREWFWHSRFFPLSILKSDEKDIAVGISRKAMDENAIYVDNTAYGLWSSPGKYGKYRFSEPVDVTIGRIIYRDIRRLL